MAHLCSLFHINHSPRTPYSPWTNGLVEVQNRNRGTHLRIFLQNPPTNWSFQTLSQLKHSPYQIVFHTHPRIPLTFSLNLPRDASKIVSQLIVNLFPFIHIIAPKTLIPSSTHSLINLSPHGFWQLRQQC